MIPCLCMQENGTSFGSNFIQLVDKVALSVDVGEGETVQFAGDELGKYTS